MQLSIQTKISHRFLVLNSFLFEPLALLWLLGVEPLSLATCFSSSHWPVHVLIRFHLWSVAHASSKYHATCSQSVPPSPVL